MPTPGHYLFNSSTLTMLPALLCSGHGYTGNLGAAAQRGSIRLSGYQTLRLSVRLSAWLTDAILCHTYEQSTESRWANKFITCLNALTINSAHTDVCVWVRVCVWVWVWARMFARCVRRVYLLPAQGLAHTHTFILNLSLSS